MMEFTGDRELVIDFRDLADFKRMLEGGLPINECIKAQCFVYGIQSSWTKNVRLSAEPDDSIKEFAEYILRSIKEYTNSEKVVDK